MLQTSLTNFADLAITRTLDRGGRRTSRPTGEVEAVKSLLLDAMPRVAALWRRALRPHHYKLGLTSLFCYSHPQVSFTRPGGGRGQCELADLLIVIDHYGPGIAWERRATLVQAKVVKTPSMGLSRKEQVQFELLSRWPRFNFIDAARYHAARARDFGGALPPQPDLSGEYGWISLSASPRRWDQYLMLMAGGFDGQAPLAPFLVNMACGFGSCGREAYRGSGDDWSDTVQELIDVTGNLPIVQAVPGQLRGRHHAISFMVGVADPTRVPTALSAAATKGDGGGDGWGDDAADEEWPSGPISVVHLRLVHIEAAS
jgi:hypothetical protein